MEFFLLCQYVQINLPTHTSLGEISIRFCIRQDSSLIRHSLSYIRPSDPQTGSLMAGQWNVHTQKGCPSELKSHTPPNLHCLSWQLLIFRSFSAGKSSKIKFKKIKICLYSYIVLLRMDKIEFVLSTVCFKHQWTLRERGICPSVC